MKYIALLVLAYLMTACTLTMSIKFMEKDAPAFEKEKAMKMESKK